jgi:hypothetical protein
MVMLLPDPKWAKGKKDTIGGYDHTVLCGIARDRACSVEALFEEWKRQGHVEPQAWVVLLGQSLDDGPYATEW